MKQSLNWAAALPRYTCFGYVVRSRNFDIPIPIPCVHALHPTHNALRKPMLNQTIDSAPISYSKGGIEETFKLAQPNNLLDLLPSQYSTLDLSQPVSTWPATEHIHVNSGLRKGLRHPHPNRHHCCSLKSSKHLQRFACRLQGGDQA